MANDPFSELDTDQADSNQPTDAFSALDDANQTDSKGFRKKPLSLSQAMGAVNQQNLNEFTGYGEGTAYGFGDIPASLKRVGANISDFFTGGNSTAQVAAENEARNAEFNKEASQNPGVGTAMGAGRFSGQVLATAPVFAAGGALSDAVGESGPPIAKFLAGQSENPLIAPFSRAFAGANTGAQVTALTNAGSNAPPDDQLSKNMLLGGGLAAGVPLVADAAGSIRDWARSPENYATNKLSQALARDQGDAFGTLQGLGPNGSLADTGPNAMRLARAVVGTPSEGSAELQQFLNERVADQPQEVLGAMYQGLGVDPEKSFEQSMDELSQQRSQQSSPLYKKAFSNDAPAWSPRIQQFLDTPEVQTGISRGLGIQRLESLANNEPFNPTDYAVKDFDADGNPIISSTPNMRLLDAGKKGLDAMISDNTDPVTGKVNELGRGLTKTKQAYVSELDNLNPDYAAARQAWAGPSESMDIANQGRQFIKNPNSVPQKDIDGLSEDDQRFFRLGAADQLRQKIEGMRDTGQYGPDLQGKILGSSTQRAALQQVFPDDESFRNFSKTVNNAAKMRQTNQQILSGSQTQNKFAEAADAGNPMFDMAHAATNPIDYIRQKASNALMNSGKLTPAKATEVSRYFTNKVPPSAGNLSQGSFLPQYMNMLAGAYGIPATEMGAQRFSSDSTQ